MKGGIEMSIPSSGKDAAACLPPLDVASAPAHQMALPLAEVLTRQHNIPVEMHLLISGQTVVGIFHGRVVRPVPHHMARFRRPPDEVAEKMTRAGQSSLAGRAKTSRCSRRIGTHAMPACLP